MNNLFAVIEHIETIDYPNKTYIAFFDSKEKALDCEKEWTLDILDNYGYEVDDNLDIDTIKEKIGDLIDADKISNYDIEIINIKNNIDIKFSY
jgi:hypothetical protein